MLLLAVSAVAYVATSQDVYKLKFLGDYQTGEWDTDAAEHVAYEKTLQRAFVASAKTSKVEVVDIWNPTRPEQVGTVAVGATLGSRCQMKSCIFDHMDFGGSSNPCGYAPMKAIIVNDEDAPGFSFPGWFQGTKQEDPTMVSAAHCQKLCADNSDCRYFSYELEDEGQGVQVHQCFLKGDYRTQDVPEGKKIEDCQNTYAVWEDGPIWDLDDDDPHWNGASGPKRCGFFQAESVQSVAVASVPGMSESVMVAASPSMYPFGNGYLSFYNAKTLEYLGCEEAGNKPEGIASNGEGKIACINEGSAREDNLLDHMGSITVCDVSAGPSFACTTYIPGPTNFVSGQWLTAQAFRQKDVRLYGPHGDSVAYDLEPEGGDFTADGKYFMVNLQDNNGYMMFDLAQKKFLFMGGYGYKEMTMDASDKDNKINIKSTWGSDAVKVHGIYMPDQVKAFTLGGTYYFITANEGGSRDDESGLLGKAGDFEGEEIRMGDPGTCTCSDCCEKENLGRLLTTTFQPSDYATNACGSNICTAKELNMGVSDDFKCMYSHKDYGGGPRSTEAATGCGNPTLVAMYVDSLNNTHVLDSDGKAHALGVYTFPSWAPSTKEVDAGMTSASACMAKCAATASCAYWSYEYHLGYHSCQLKEAFSGAKAHCGKYVTWNGKFYDYSGFEHWEGYSGPKSCPFAKAPYTNTPGTSNDGSPGGSYAIGGRSFTIWSWSGGSSTTLTQVFDSGDAMEVESSKVNHGLCDGCDDAANKDRCKAECPFNSDEAPPKLDDRSDAKGPEPECVTVGEMLDGTLLAFVGLERTGGIITYDISTPADSKFQDLLNVRNWMVTGSESADMIKHALNDGPESLVFISALDSPIGVELLLAVTPLAGRLTVYMIEKGAARGNDGSCKDTATCEYIPTAHGGLGTARELTACDVCRGSGCNRFNCARPAPAAASSDSSSSDDDDDGVSVGALIGIIVGVVVVCLILAGGLFVYGKSVGAKTARDVAKDKKQNPMTGEAIGNAEL